MQATPALLERAAARVEIDELEVTLGTATTEPQRATLRKQIETKSIAARVVSTQATMLVLDSDDDYARYGIDRNALADILVVGPHGLEQQHRTFVASKDRRPLEAGSRARAAEAIEAARIAGILGSSDDRDTASGGGGTGLGRSATAVRRDARSHQPRCRRSRSANRR